MVSLPYPLHFRNLFIIWSAPAAFLSFATAVYTYLVLPLWTLSTVFPFWCIYVRLCPRVDFLLESCFERLVGCGCSYDFILIIACGNSLLVLPSSPWNHYPFYRFKLILLTSRSFASMPILRVILSLLLQALFRPHPTILLLCCVLTTSSLLLHMLVVLTNCFHPSTILVPALYSFPYRSLLYPCLPTAREIALHFGHFFLELFLFFLLLQVHYLFSICAISYRACFSFLSLVDCPY